MVHVRSSRQLERSCGENIAFMWLPAMQRPDHVTLGRFSSNNRPAMRKLLKQMVWSATEVGLVDAVLQAVDGSRVDAASLDSLHERENVTSLLAQVEKEIAAMERAHQGERVSITDPEAVVMKSRHGYQLGHNGQVVVDSKTQIIIASDSVACASDSDQEAPMVAETQAMSERLPQERPPAGIVPGA